MTKTCISALPGTTVGVHKHLCLLGVELFWASINKSLCGQVKRRQLEAVAALAAVGFAACRPAKAISYKRILFFFKAISFAKGVVIGLLTSLMSSVIGAQQGTGLTLRQLEAVAALAAVGLAACRPAKVISYKRILFFFKAISFAKGVVIGLLTS
jgi:hypothetical protein